MTGEVVDKAQTVSFQGKTVGFCCGKCKAAFEKEPDKFAGKLGIEGKDYVVRDGDVMHFRFNV